MSEQQNFSISVTQSTRIAGRSTGVFEENTFLAALKGGHDPKGTALEKVNQLCQQQSEKEYRDLRSSLKKA